MVSPLSSRIINLEAKVKIKKRIKEPDNSNFPWQLESRKKRISGYTADGEGVLHEVSSEKRLNAEKVEANAKRRRTEEKNFQAHNVQNDLAAAGKVYIPRSRALPLGTVDMSRVELVTSSKYQEESAAADTKGDSLNNTMSAYEEHSAYASLFEASTAFYHGTKKQQKHCRISRSSARSITSETTGSTSLSSSPFYSDEDEVASPYPPPPVQLPVKVFKGLAEKVQEYKVSSILSTAKSNFMSLESALVSSESARLIIEAQEPHNIIHSNASFSQFSGISSDQLLGCSLSKFISDSENQENVKIHLPETSNNLCGNQKDQAGGVLLCKFTVHKVRSNVAGEDKKSQFSHFVLDFEKVATIEKKRVRMGSVAVVG